MLCVAQVSGYAQHEVALEKQKLLRYQMGIPSVDSLLHKTHAERYVLFQRFSGANIPWEQQDTLAVGKLFVAMEQEASKKNDKDLIRELQRLRFIMRLSHVDQGARIQMLENEHERAKESGEPWEVFISSWTLAHHLIGHGQKVDVAMYMLIEASETLEKGYRHPIAHTLNYHLGAAHYAYNDFSGAKKYFSRALRWGEKDGKHHVDSRVLNNLGLIHRKLKSLDSSDMYLNEALAQSILHGDTIMVGIVSGNLGENQFLRGNYDEALPLLEKDARLAIALQDHGLASNALMVMAETHLIRGDLEKCKPLLDMGREYAYRSGQYHRLRTLYPLLAKWHIKQGESELAILYTDSAMFVVDSLERIQMQWRVLPSDQLHEMHQVQLALADQEHHTQIRNMLVLAISLVLLIVILLFQLFRARTAIHRTKLETENEDLHAQLSDARMKLDEFISKITEPEGDLALLHQAIIVTEQGWLEFSQLFEACFPGYKERVKQLYPELTKAEFRFMCLLKLQLSNRQLAAMLGVGQNAIQQLYRRTRRKLNIASSTELAELAQTL